MKQTSTLKTQLKHQLRIQMKQKRLALSSKQQERASLSIINPALGLIEKYQAQKMAFYMPFKAEISPLALMDILIEKGKEIYLPVLDPNHKGRLLFLKYHNQSFLVKNHFGIFEPILDKQNSLPLYELDMMFLPLVAFDKLGNRLGMGGGFYDRTLDQMNTKCVTVGLAHQCQQVDILPVESWDQKLDYILVG